jgi:putative restriction endonuclease
MQYWWVNQNQTYKHEVGGGYMWSPKNNSNGGMNQFYINMTLVQPGDIIYSFCETYIKAIGVATRKAVSSTKPTEFGTAGANWTENGWLVEVEFHELEHPIKPSQHMDLLTPTLPEKYSPIRPDGGGNQVYLANIPQSMAMILNKLLNNKVQQIYDQASLINDEQSDQLDAELELLKRKDIPETEKQQLVKARRGQGLFRSRVSMIEPACRITGVTKKAYLRASHIKPWSKSNDTEKLDGNNGLMLSPHVDYLFDKGLISFLNNGDILVSSKLDRKVMHLWNIPNDMNVGKFSNHQSIYLEYHRLEVFLK